MIDFIKDADCTKETPVRLGVPDAPIYGKGIKLKPRVDGRTDSEHFKKIYLPELLPLEEYDLIVVLISGGKDSVACYLKLLELGVPKERIEFWHHDIDGGHPSRRMDWKCTQNYVKALADAEGIKLRVSYRVNGFFGELYRIGASEPIEWIDPDTGEVRQCKLSSNYLKCKELKEQATEEMEELLKQYGYRMKFPAKTGDLSRRWCSAYLKICVADTVVSNLDRLGELEELGGKRHKFPAKGGTHSGRWCSGNLKAAVQDSVTANLEETKHDKKILIVSGERRGESAGRLVMTEEAFFSSAAQKDCFTELDVEQFEIVATLDSHTSDICRGMDGKHFPMSEWKVGVTAPPFHVHCRSTTVPYFDDEFDAVGERAARDEKTGKTYFVPGNMTYKEWEKAFVNGGDKSGLQEALPDDTIKTEEKKTVDDCETVEQVQDLMKDQQWFRVAEINGHVYDTNERIGLKGLDLGCAKSIYKTHEQLFDKFPQLKGKLNAVGSTQLGGMTYAQCSFGLGHGGVTVNTKYFSDMEKLAKSYEKDLQAGFHPKGTDFSAIVMHELGHAIDDYLSYTEMVCGLLNNYRPKIVSADLRPKVMRSCGLKVSDIRNEVSGYATKDAQEWFAECFAEYMVSDEPRPVAAKFGEMLEELLKGVK